VGIGKRSILGIIQTDSNNVPAPVYMTASHTAAGHATGAHSARTGSGYVPANKHVLAS